jgi:hypothetical protein
MAFRICYHHIKRFRLWKVCEGHARKNLPGVPPSTTVGGRAPVVNTCAKICLRNEEVLKESSVFSSDVPRRLEHFESSPLACWWNLHLVNCKRRMNVSFADTLSVLRYIHCAPTRRKAAAAK